MWRLIGTKTIVVNGEEITLTNERKSEVINRQLHVTKRWITKNGTLCSPDREEPAYALYIDGVVECMEWCDLEGKLHRGGGLPARIYFMDGKLFSENWFVHGEWKRAGDKPTEVIYGEHERIIKEVWMASRSDFHRLNDLPAIIKYRDGIVVEQHWYKNNVKYFPQFENQAAKKEDAEPSTDDKKATIDDCPVCPEPKRRRVAYGCEHATVCVDCDAYLKECPLCREPIALRIRLYQ